jgi:O-antigen/teichoic acid export membrane protein
MPINSKLIAKNTILLYVRMILLMAVTLYTSRVILAVLGIDDYGIYSLIGGIIALFSFISSSLVSAMQRFFNVALGKKDYALYHRVYVMGYNIFFLFSLFLLLIGETIGLWYVNNKLNIPIGRETAAFWVYQISIITLIIQLLRTPDNASIIAHERMNFYAYISVGEAFLKLGIVFFLQLFVFDKLILYVLLYFASTTVINLIYKIYCNLKFAECHYDWLWDKFLFKEMLSFSGWTLLSNGSRTVTMQGENIFLNQSYSVSVNAARGIAAQVYNAVNTFLVNFQTAFKPQLTKSYAAGETENHFSLLYRSSKFSFYLLLVLVIPILFNLDTLLGAWLVEVPKYTKEFCLFVLLAYLADALASPLGTSVSANGNIKGLQISIAVVFVIQLIASFFALQAGWPPYVVSVFILVSHTIHYIFYVYFCNKLCDLRIGEYFKQVILPLIPICILAPTLPFYLQRYSSNIWLALGLCVVDVLWVLLFVWLLGMTKDEKRYVSSAIIKIIKK